MRIQVFQHVAFEGPRKLPAGRKSAGIRWRRHRGLMARPRGFGGGGRPCRHGRAHEYLRAPAASLVKSGKGFSHAGLGTRPASGEVCLGAQLLADVLGGRVCQNPVREIGWWPVRWRETARSAPGWNFLPKTTTPLHWHGDTFSLPPGAQWLAETDECAHQAFAWGRLALGLQFHLEASNDSLEALIKNCGEEVAGGGTRVQTTGQLREGLALHQRENLPFLWKLLDAWFR